MIQQSIMPVYQNKKTKKWKFRTYAEDVYGNHKQFERKWFDTKKEALQSEREFKLSDRTKYRIYSLTNYGQSIKSI